MKVPPARADRFVAGPDPDLIVLLLYGPDRGLARERADIAAKAVAGTLDDPFRVAEIQAGDLAKDPARLLDEAGALAFGGGRRAVRLKGAGDGATQPVKDALATLSAGDGAAPALIVIEAGELGTRSSLRRLIEGAERGAAIGCYLDDGAALGRVVTETLRAHGLTPDADARTWLTEHLGADRRVTRGELEKLALYCAGKDRVTLADCEAVVGDATSNDLDSVVLAAAGGDLGGLDVALARAFREGITAVAVLRAAMRHMQRLDRVAGAIAAGATIEAAMKGLKPPVFYKVADRFRAQARAWPPDRTATALALLTEAEIQCKSTGRPDTLICARALMQIATAGRRARRS